ncbi:hypothetical protein Tco_1173684 [Tanacetum coccineum]
MEIAIVNSSAPIYDQEPAAFTNDDEMSKEKEIDKLIGSLHFLSLIRQPTVVPISTKEPKQTVNQSVVTSYKETVATDSTVKKPRNIISRIYKQVSKTCNWWYPKFTPPKYNWKPKSPTGKVNLNVSMPLGNASRTANILETHMTP